MAQTGAAYLDSSGLKEFKRALRETAGNVSELRPAMEDIGRYALDRERLDAPMEGLSVDRAGRGHLRPGSLRMGMRARPTSQNVWLESDWGGPLMLQAFGGTSYWYRGQGMHGLIRQFDTEGGVSYKHKHRQRVSRDLGSIARRYGLSGHVVYTKPHRSRGYFLWNWVFKHRHYVIRTLAERVQAIAEAHGLHLDLSTDYGASGEWQAPEHRR